MEKIKGFHILENRSHRTVIYEAREIKEGSSRNAQKVCKETFSGAWEELESQGEQGCPPDLRSSDLVLKEWGSHNSHRLVPGLLQEGT